jgi:hypothetical protein
LPKNRYAKNKAKEEDESMSEIEAFNHKYVSEYSSAFQDSKFYVEDDVVREVYYNPDSNSGGQLVTNLYHRRAILP